MSITSVRLQQFKCFADSGEVPLAPLTVIFGRNNSGKSSILQSLLLLRQTLESPEYGPRLDLRGPLYAAGSFADIVHQHRTCENLQMRVRIRHGVPEKTSTVDMEFASDEPQPPRLIRLRVENGDAPPLEICRSRGRGGPYAMSIDGVRQGTENDAIFRFPESGFFPLIGSEPPRVGRPSERRGEARMAARQALEALEKSLREMRTVGAFRQQPLRRYEYLGRPAQSADATGRAVMEALIEDSMRRGAQRGALVREVNRWLKVVGRVRILKLRRIAKVARIFEVRVRDDDSRRWANFADVGFGIGQAFPVLVEGLRTPEGAMFLVQEPEIHLHPDAQLHMADFLVSLARNGRRVVVETHSEHLLLRIRRRMLAKATSRSRIAPSEVSIVYVAKDTEGASSVRTLSVDELAQITDWPEGFMEEATDERMEILTKQAALADSRG
jgi:predicted ATPase